MRVLLFAACLLARTRASPLRVVHIEGELGDAHVKRPARNLLSSLPRTDENDRRDVDAEDYYSLADPSQTEENRWLVQNPTEDTWVSETEGDYNVPPTDADGEFIAGGTGEKELEPTMQETPQYAMPEPMHLPEPANIEPGSWRPDNGRPEPWRPEPSPEYPSAPEELQEVPQYAMPEPMQEPDSRFGGAEGWVPTRTIEEPNPEHELSPTAVAQEEALPDADAPEESSESLPAGDGSGIKVLHTNEDPGPFVDPVPDVDAAGIKVLHTSQDSWPSELDKVEPVNQTEERIKREKVLEAVNGFKEYYNMSLVAALEFEVVVHDVTLGDAVFVVGDREQIGAWNPYRGFELYTSAAQYPKWTNSGPLVVAAGNLHYKLIVMRQGRNGNVHWETTNFGEDNREVFARSGTTTKIRTSWGNMREEIDDYGGF